MKRLYPKFPRPSYKRRSRETYRWLFDRRIGKRRDPFRFDGWEPKQIYWETLRRMFA